MIGFGSGNHFIIEEVKKLIYFIKPQCFLTLLQVAYKTQSYT